MKGCLKVTVVSVVRTMVGTSSVLINGDAGFRRYFSSWPRYCCNGRLFRHLPLQFSIAEFLPFGHVSSYARKSVPAGAESASDDEIICGYAILTVIAVILLCLCDAGFGRDHHARNGGGILQRDAHHLGGIDDARLDHIDIPIALGVVAE